MYSGTLGLTETFPRKNFQTTSNIVARANQRSVQVSEITETVKHEQRVITVRKGSLNPFVFATNSGGARPSASRVMFRTVQKVSWAVFQNLRIRNIVVVAAVKKQ